MGLFSWCCLKCFVVYFGLNLVVYSVYEGFGLLLLVFVWSA